MDEDNDIPNDKLLDMPTDSLSGLSRLWTVRSGLQHDRMLAELAAERNGFSIHRNLSSEQEKAENARRHHADFERLLAEMRDRADRLLLHIEEYEAQLEKRRQEDQRRALHLRDGRHAYVDGAHYRDEQGEILQGRDHDEAASLHLQNPNATTWREHQVINQRIADAEDLRQRVETERAGEEPPDRLTDYEKGLKQQMAAAAKDATPDYGDPDYMSLSSAPAFNDAASSDTVKAPTDQDIETETAQLSLNKKLSRSSVQGVPKPS